METRTVQLLNGLYTRVLDTGGDRPVLVLVHGLANALEIWERVLPQLSSAFRVIAFDLPGFGQASRPDAAYDGDFFAGQLLAVLDTLELERAHLVGSSLGAGTILRLPARVLDRIDRVVLAAPGGFGRRTSLLMRTVALPVIGAFMARPTPLANLLTLRLAMHDRRHVTPALVELTNRYARLPGSDRSFTRSLQTGVGLLGSKHLKTVASLARSFTRPALVVWGRNDRVFPASQALRAAALLPASELRLIDRCGHYPHWEQPEAFGAAVLPFLG